MALRTLDAERAGAVERLCELIVPGSGRVGPVVYVDALLTGMPPPVRDGALAAIDALAPAAAEGPDALAEQAQTPEFGFVRALAIEAYYSDFVAPWSLCPTSALSPTSVCRAFARSSSVGTSQARW